MPYDDAGTYIDKDDIVYHEQSVTGYGVIFLLLLILTGILFFVFKTISPKPQFKALNEYDDYL